jgi:hypothetical protein
MDDWSIGPVATDSMSSKSPAALPVDFLGLGLGPGLGLGLVGGFFFLCSSSNFFFSSDSLFTLRGLPVEDAPESLRSLGFTLLVEDAEFVRWRGLYPLEEEEEVSRVLSLDFDLERGF